MCNYFLYFYFTVFFITIVLLGCPPLNPGDIISSHAVEPRVQLNCNYLCFKEPRCVGYNFRSGTNDKSMINCQLTSISKMKNDTKQYEGDWTLIYEVDAVSKCVYLSCYKLRTFIFYHFCQEKYRAADVSVSCKS